MTLLALSFSFRSASLEFRERIAFTPGEKMDEAYALWKSLLPGTEVVLISTCNRVEIYAVGDDAAHLEADQLQNFVSVFSGVSTEEVRISGQLLSGLDAVRHLYRVTSGMDSIAIGESQIVAQVKSAYELAVSHGTTARVIHQLFQSALSTSAEIRTQTLISAGRLSIASVAINDCVKNSLGSLNRKRVLVIGAGEMAEESLTYLASEGVVNPEIVNRSLERAAQLADRFGGTAYPLSSIVDRIGLSDVIITATSATMPILTKARLNAAREKMGFSPVCIVDLSTPRNVDPNIRSCTGVTVFDLQDLEAAVRKNGDLRNTQLGHAAIIISDRLVEFQRYMDTRSVDAIVKESRDEASTIAAAELQSLFQKPLGFDEPQATAVERAVSRIVNKVLHKPLKNLKAEATNVRLSGC